MLLKEFYRTVVSSEIACCNFLKDHLLLGDEDSHEPCQKCGSQMTEKRRKNRKGEWTPVVRCSKKGCQTMRSVRHGNAFFHYTDVNNRLNSKLTLCEIMELAYLFVLEIPIHQVITLTGRAEGTVTDWYNMSREVCSAVLSKKPQMEGSFDHPIQIDEARFAGRRKYNRGRMLLGDEPPNSTDDEADVVNRRNHGTRVDGPWVFGLRKGNDFMTRTTQFR